jgi:hypothetical protein
MPVNWELLDDSESDLPQREAMVYFRNSLWWFSNSNRRTQPGLPGFSIELLLPAITRASLTCTTLSPGMGR